MKRWIIAASVFAALSLVAAACGDDKRGGGADNTSATTTTKAPQTGGTLRFGVYSEIQGLDPIVGLGSGTSGGIQMGAIYDTIMRWNPTSNKYENQISESVTANADATEWTIKLKPNIKFTDGTDYDAAAVVFGMNRHRSGLPGAPKCEEIIACPRSTNSSAVYMALVKDLQAVDKLTVKATLTEPWTSFQFALASEPAMIPSPTALKQCDPTKNPNTCPFNLKPVGAGPFMVESSYKTGEPLRVIRNPNYWGGKTYLDAVEFINANDTGGLQTLEAFKAGTTQGAYLRNPEAIKSAKDAKIAGFSTLNQSGNILLMNMGVTVTCAAGKPEPLCVGKPDGPTATTPVTRDLKVRQAIAAALDPKAIDQRATNSTGIPTSSMFTSEFPWDPKVAGPKYDLDAAKRLVQEAKAAGWNGQLSWVTVNSPQGNAVGLAVEAQLKAAGIDVRSEAKESTAQQQMVITLKNFELTVWGTSAGPDDSALWAMAQNFLSTSASNRVGFKSTIVDQALKDIRAAKTDDEKRAGYKKIAEEVAAQLPIYVFTATEEYRIYSSKLHGIVPGHKSYVFFDKAWMET